VALAQRHGPHLQDISAALAAWAGWAIAAEIARMSGFGQMGALPDHFYRFCSSGRGRGTAGAAGEPLGVRGLLAIGDEVNGGDGLRQQRAEQTLRLFLGPLYGESQRQGFIDVPGRAYRGRVYRLRIDPELLPWHDVIAYRTIDPRNARLRSLIENMVDIGAWQLLWVPPSLSYYHLEGPYANSAVVGFTKRLVFSSWQVVPKVIAMLVSYAAERQMISLHEPQAENTSEARARRRGLLAFSRSEGRLNGMPMLALVYPCITLARKYDPLVVAQELKPHKDWPTLRAITAQIRARIAANL
jgi:hypothetical protein